MVSTYPFYQLVYARMNIYSTCYRMRLFGWSLMFLSILEFRYKLFDLPLGLSTQGVSSLTREPTLTEELKKNTCFYTEVSHSGSWLKLAFWIEKLRLVFKYQSSYSATFEEWMFNVFFIWSLCLNWHKISILTFFQFSEFLNARKSPTHGDGGRYSQHYWTYIAMQLSMWKMSL